MRSLPGSVLPGDFFYSNNPESITDQLADRGIYLNHARLHGDSIHVFYWHQNASRATLNSAMYLGNPGSSDVTVTVGRRGIIPLHTPSNVESWFQYHAPDHADTVTVPARGYALLYPQAVRKGAIFGGVVHLSMTAAGSASPLEMYDIAYESSSKISLKALASPDGTNRRRGTGNGYQTTISVGSDVFTASHAGPRGFTIGSENDSIGSPGGADLVTVTDPATGLAAPLGGNYGVLYNIAWTMENSDRVAHTFTLYAGNHNTGGSNGTNFMINYAPSGLGIGGCPNPHPPLLPGWYLAFLQDTVQPQDRVLYNFQLCTIGGFSYPLTLAVGT